MYVKKYGINAALKGMLLPRLGLAIGLALFSLPVGAGVQEHVQAGEQALADHNPAEAVAAFNRAYQTANLSPAEHATALAGRCAARYQQHLESNNGQRARQAITNCDRSIQIQSDHAPSYRLRGMAYLRLGQPQRALPDLNVAVALHPNDVLAIQHRGVAKIQLNLLESAMDDLNRAIQLDPAHPDSYYYRGKLHAIAARHGEAVADYHLFFQRIQKDPSAYQQAEQNRLLAETRPEAVADFNKALSMQPVGSVLHTLQASIHPPETTQPDTVQKPLSEPQEPRSEPQEPLPGTDHETDMDATIDNEVAKKQKYASARHVKGKFAFKVESFRNSANADRALGQATRLNLRVYVETVLVDQTPRIRVWVGPFDSLAEAEQAHKKMEAAGYKPAPPRQF